MADSKSVVAIFVLLVILLSTWFFVLLSRIPQKLSGCNYSDASLGSAKSNDDVVVLPTNGSKTRGKLTLIHISQTGGAALEKWGKLHGFAWGSSWHGYRKEELGRQDVSGLHSRSTVPPWHSPPQLLQQSPYEDVDAFVVVRNPYDRMISEFRCPWNGFHAPRQSGLGQNEQDAKMKWRSAATVDDLNEWVIAKLRHGAARPPFANGYMVPQHLYIVGPRNEWWVTPKNVLRKERLWKDFANLKSRYSISGGPFKYTDESEMKTFRISDLSERARRLIEQEYSSDFEHFGYQKFQKLCPWSDTIKCMDCPKLPQSNFSDGRFKPAEPCKKRGKAAHRYIFILAAAYTGSSAISGLFMTMPGSQVANLCPATSWQCEGLKVLQNLGWNEASDKEKFTANFNWNLVFEIYENIWDMSRYFLLEKLFEIIYHIEKLVEYVRASKNTALWVVMTRSPCTMKTFFDGPYPKAISRKDRQLLHVDRFLRSQGEDTVHVRYEDLMLRPYESTQRIVNFEPCLHGIDPGKLADDLLRANDEFENPTQDSVALQCKLASRYGKKADNGDELGKWVRNCSKNSRRAGRRLMGNTPLSIVEYSKKKGLRNHLEVLTGNYSEFLDHFGYLDSVKNT